MLQEMADDKDRANLRQQIDENLKRVYEAELDREIPDKFTQLLQQLRQKEGDE